MSRLSLLLLSLLLLSLVAACSPSEPVPGEAQAEAQNGRLVVYTVNYPLAFFAEQIGGRAVRVEFPAPRDVDPAYWSPEPATIVAYQEADMILLNGADYAKWVQRASLPASRTVNTGASQASRLIQLEDEVTHAHGPDGGHNHGETAITTWLDPTLAVGQLRTIASVFSAARPRQREAFESNLATLEAELMKRDELIKTSVARGLNRPLLGSHPVYQYLAERYGLKLVSVHWEPDETPDDESWSELELMLETHPAKWMLWEGEPLPEIAERLRGLGVESVVFDPCANVPDGSRDYLDVMQANAVALQRAFETP